MNNAPSKKMWLLLIVAQEKFVQDILAAFIELDINGATIINSQGMGRTLAFEFPIFAGFMSEMKHSKPYNKTIFATIDDLEKVDKLRKLLKEIDIDFTQPDTGVLFTLPICRAIGTHFEYYENEND